MDVYLCTSRLQTDVYRMLEPYNADSFNVYSCDDIYFGDLPTLEGRGWKSLPKTLQAAVVSRVIE